MPERSYTHRLWTPEEDRIIDRHARALARGKYRFAADAVRACLLDLGKLPDRTSRTAAVTHVRLKKRMSVLGLPWVGEALTDEEERVVQRYLSGIARGQYDRVRAAARQCRDELVRLPVGRRSWLPRSVQALGRLMARRLRAAGVTWGNARWTTEEDAVARRYAQALAAGRLPDARVAADRCLAALARLGALRGSRCLLTRIALAARLRRLAREAGWPSFIRPWRPEEQAVRDRYVAALVQGEFRTAKRAAAACTKELTRLHQRMRNSPSYVGTLPRSYGAVLRELNDRALDLGLPRYGDKWRPPERRLLERYARGVPAGRYGSWLEAARACHAELARLHERIRRRSPIPVRTLPERKLIEVHKHIIAVAHELGLEGPRRVLWTEAEDKVCDSWVRWYARYRGVRRLEPFKTAAEGLQEDLLKLGSERSLPACRCRLAARHRSMMGPH